MVNDVPHAVDNLDALHRGGLGQCTALWQIGLHGYLSYGRVRVRPHGPLLFVAPWSPSIGDNEEPCVRRAAYVGCPCDEGRGAAVSSDVGICFEAPEEVGVVATILPTRAQGVGSAQLQTCRMCPRAYPCHIGKHAVYPLVEEFGLARKKPLCHCRVAARRCDLEGDGDRIAEGTAGQVEVGERPCTCIGRKSGRWSQFPSDRRSRMRRDGQALVTDAAQGIGTLYPRFGVDLLEREAHGAPSRLEAACHRAYPYGTARKAVGLDVHAR